MIKGLSKRKLNKAGRDINETALILLPHMETLIQNIQESINRIQSKTEWTTDQTLKLLELLENKQFEVNEEEEPQNEPMGFTANPASIMQLP